MKFFELITETWQTLFTKKNPMSRLKKKLLLYFVLTAVVSISVSAEIILEIGSPAFKKSFFSSIEKELIKEIGTENAKDILENKIKKSTIFEAVTDLQIRMILMLIVVSISISGAFLMFIKDIVSPMEGMVEATKKIADGDLSASVPVKTEDEIGQIGNLINEMSVNLQDLILQIRGELIQLRNKISAINDKINKTLGAEELKKAVKSKKIKTKNVSDLIQSGEEMHDLLQSMQTDLTALQAFVDLYKVFQIPEEDETFMKEAGL
ncbi:MAG: HAMP domain-containing protein [Spirochaetia bacterium]|nr:HAMP domain-containing protein [Spirochaetia bacterium]